MASFEPDGIDFEDRYDKLDPIDDADLDTSMNELNELIREQEELESRITRAEWKSMDKNEQTKLEQQIALNEEKQSQYIMRASKTMISILHRSFDKIKQDGRVMVLDEKSAEKLYDRLYLVKSEGIYKVAFENDSKTHKDILSPTNRWLVPNAYLRIFGKKFMKDIGFDADKPKSGTKSKIPKKRMEQMEHFNSFFLYLLDVNSKHAPTQVETVLTIASEALIGNPTTVTDVPIVETPLAKATELAPVDTCSNLL